MDSLFSSLSGVKWSKPKFCHFKIIDDLAIVDLKHSETMPSLFLNILLLTQKKNVHFHVGSVGSIQPELILGINQLILHKSVRVSWLNLSVHSLGVQGWRCGESTRPSTNVARVRYPDAASYVD